MKTSERGARAVCVLALFCLSAAVLRATAAGAAEAGRIYVTSTPRGARVFLDEETEPRAKTPCLLSGISAGKHVVRASLTGYVDVTKEVDVTGDEMARAMLTFTTKKADEPVDGTGPAPSGTGPAPKASAEGTSREKEGPPKYVEADCPACKGTGLIQEMGCPKCNATGYVDASACAHCAGQGHLEHRCSACKGTGTIAFGGKEGTCALCRGKGKLPCLLCRGGGKIKRLNPETSRKPTTTCPMCEGTGFECKSKCLRCSGKGTMLVGTGGMMGGAGPRGVAPGAGGQRQGAYITVKCPFCGGDGIGPPICRRCRGSGVVSPHKNPTPCRACSGTGQLFSPCRGCRGRGWIVSK